ncbi:MAG TPA: GlsB/YeaQ/YmgE family stress response membrane protein [Longimicrobiaceae bacterium]|nr:GlsB/YeaQ/YmgE family stress response membrane protein [Longimicrobiaceae bacterium]
MGSIIWMLIIGLIAGALAKLIMPGRDPGGIIVTILLGIAGSFVGGLLANMLGLGDGNSTVGLIGSVIGALILLFLYRMIAGRRHTRV